SEPGETPQNVTLVEFEEARGSPVEREGLTWKLLLKTYSELSENNLYPNKYYRARKNHYP
ncbi:hypothetical protein SAMN05216362_105128, partial [Piscibacillus halophilus]